MITFAYDETDGFEVPNSTPAFIAGVIYDSKKEKDYQGVICERARLEAYFRAVCADCEQERQQGKLEKTIYKDGKEVPIRFPRDLHRNTIIKKDNQPKVDNKIYEKAVKECLNETLAEYLTNGTYKGQELLFLNDLGELVFEKTSKPVKRHGKYQLITVQKSNDANIPDTTKMVYREMVRSIIQKGIYTNPDLSMENQVAFINAPTRVIPDNNKNPLSDIIRSQLSTQGYRYENSQKMWFVLESGDIRGIVDNLDNSFCTQDAPVKPELFIRKMSAGFSLNKDDHVAVRQFVFLFLADALCSFLKDKQKEESKISDIKYADGLLKAMKLLNPAPANKLYLYDKPTAALDQINENIMKGAYFEALSGLWDYEVSFTAEPCQKIHDLYRKEITANLKSHFSAKTMAEAIDKLDKYRRHKLGSFDPDRLYGIFKKLLSLFKSQVSDESAVFKELRAKLYAVGGAAATHIGDTRQAYDFYMAYMKEKRIDLTSDNLPTVLDSLSEETTEVITQFLTMNNDFFDYEKSEENACKLLGVRSCNSLLV